MAMKQAISRDVSRGEPLAQGGTDEESNLWLACPLCNGHKSDRVRAADPVTGEVISLFNPRTQRWPEHFTWSEGGLRIAGLTAVGQATVRALRLDDEPDAVLVRSYWISAGWHTPSS